MTRLVLAAALAAVAAVVVPASAAGCPTGTYSRGSGLYSPLSGKEIRYCYPTPPPAL